jgi:hypothetical protein
MQPLSVRLRDSLLPLGRGDTNTTSREDRDE